MGSLTQSVLPSYFRLFSHGGRERLPPPAVLPDPVAALYPSRSHYLAPMPEVYDELADPHTPEERREAILGTFLKEKADRQTRSEWNRLLADDHGIHRLPWYRRWTGLLLLVMTVLLLLFAIGYALRGPAAAPPDVFAAEIEALTLSVSRTNEARGPDSLRARMLAAFSTELYPEALRLSEELLREYPERPLSDALNHVHLLLRNGEYATAARLLEGTTLAGNLPPTQLAFLRGIALYRSGATTAGLRDLRVAASASGRWANAARRILDGVQ